VCTIKMKKCKKSMKRQCKRMCKTYESKEYKP
jgi:hypothetical protein